MSLTWKKILICELFTIRNANTNCYHSKIIKLSTLLLQRTKQYLVQPELDLSGSLRMACRYQLYILRAQRPKTHNNDLKIIQGKHFQFYSQQITFQGRKIVCAFYNGCFMFTHHPLSSYLASSFYTGLPHRVPQHHYTFHLDIRTLSLPWFRWDSSTHEGRCHEWC